jgi:hypothetical protein
MMAINEKNNDQEWRALFAQLSSPPQPEALPTGPMFEDAGARKRVGDLITKAVLGESAYNMYALYYANKASEL